MCFKLKVYLVAIAGLQCVCLSMILMGITGGYDGAGYQGHDGNRDGRTGNSSAGTETSMGGEVPDKVVLVVIDALRVDFLTEENFPFLMGTLDKYQSTSVMKFDVKVDSPTVTLPRVKTLVTGKAPVYLDVLRNFQTSDTLKSNPGINQPNLISMLRKELPDFNICFFGDETWLRLFPPEDDKYSPFFKKWEGVTSFYVRDFYEVDNNVTRHLDDIDECNFIILHYLGLDHIGHVYGPKQTDLLKRKLIEMDHVVKHLHSHFSNLKTKQAKNLMLITGDHGMANGGGHGGSSYEEVMTPLVSVVIGGMPQHRSRTESVQINQIDIAPTLASIWNTAIPQDSRGQLILDIIEHFKSTDQLANSYQRNCKHLLQVLGDSRKGATYNLWWNEISKMEKPLAIKKYIELEHELSSTLQTARDKNRNLLYSFTVSMVLLICTEIYLFSCLKKIVGRYARFALGTIFVPPLITYFSSSFIEEEHYIRYYLYPAMIVISVLWNEGYKWENLITVLKIMFLHRVAMSLNQTGDKWSHLPDWNDFILERHLQWLTATSAVILIYAYSLKTVKCSKSFKAALLSVYVTRLVTSYVDESTRMQWHWLLMDGKLQKLSFCVVFFHFIHHIYKGSVYPAVTSTALLFLLSLHRCQNFIVVCAVFVQVYLLDKLIRRPYSHSQQRQDKPNKSSTRLHSLLSRILVIWFAHASFYYQGNSNGLATVDVNAGYIGVESYSSNLLIGSLILLNTYSSPILIYLLMARSPGSDQVVMNGSTSASNHVDSKAKGKAKDKSSKLVEFLPLLIVLSNGAECIVYACSLLIFQNHLFIWSVFVPKLLYLVTQSLVCAISSSFYIFVK